MKKLLLASLILLISLMILPACKKKYKCECINTNFDTGTQYTIDNSYDKKLSKSQANTKKEECEATPDCTFLRDKDKNKK